LKKDIFVCLRYLYREFHYESFIYVLYSKLFHILHFSPFYLSFLLMVISMGLKFLYSFLYRKYIIHIHFLYFLCFIPIFLFYCLLMHYYSNKDLKSLKLFAMFFSYFFIVFSRTYHLLLVKMSFKDENNSVYRNFTPR
jgi:hypothetical protein